MLWNYQIGSPFLEFSQPTNLVQLEVLLKSTPAAHPAEKIHTALRFTRYAEGISTWMQSHEVWTEPNMVFPLNARHGTICQWFPFRVSCCPIFRYGKRDHDRRFSPDLIFCHGEFRAASNDNGFRELRSACSRCIHRLPSNSMVRMIRHILPQWINLRCGWVAAVSLRWHQWHQWWHRGKVSLFGTIRTLATGVKNRH